MEPAVTLSGEEHFGVRTEGSQQESKLVDMKNH